MSTFGSIILINLVKKIGLIDVIVLWLDRQTVCRTTKLQDSTTRMSLYTGLV